MPKRNARLLAPLLALTLSFVGCATPSTPLAPPVAAPKIPPPSPELMQEPPLSGSYSEHVRRLLLEWQERLTAWRRNS